MSIMWKDLTSRHEKSSFVEYTIDGVSYRFDSKDCAIMFKRFLSVYGNDFKRFSGQQQYISDPFWDKAIPKEHEINEIEEERLKNISGTIQEKSNQHIVVISDPLEIQQLGINLVRSAKEDIAIIFSTSNAFRRQLCIGGIQFLEEVRKSNKYVNIRLITPVNDEIRKISVDLKRNFGIDVKHIVDSMQSKITLVVIDRKFSLAVELKMIQKIIFMSQQG